MRNKIIDNFEKKIFSSKTSGVQALPEFRSGDTVCVHYKIREAGDSKKVRVQPFEGVVIRYKKGLADGTFTVRKISAGGIGVERVFPLYSPNIAKVEVKAKGVVRRSRLFYLRDLAGKAARIKSKFGGLFDKTAAAATTATTEVEPATTTNE